MLNLFLFRYFSKEFHWIIWGVGVRLGTFGFVHSDGVFWWHLLSFFFLLVLLLFEPWQESGGGLISDVDAEE